MRDRLNTLYEAGATRRFHNIADFSGTPLQTVAEHSWGVALIAVELIERIGSSKMSSELVIRAALYHDLAESVTGDVPAPTKWENPELGLALSHIERRFEEKFEISVTLVGIERQILKWADALELYCYCQRRAASAPAYALCVQKIYGYMTENLQPLPEALQLLKELTL
jgi:5'-deoxynucleotidase YfbR-like HD superfamily hydrolase